MLKRTILILAVLVLLAAVPVAQLAMRAGGSVDVEVEPLAPRTIRTSVLASGHLAHENEVELMSEEIGTVSRIHVREGQRLERGQLLLQIDDEA